MTSSPLPSNMSREAIVDEIRGNLNFLYARGARKDYTYEKIASMLNGQFGTKYDKGSIRRFLKGTSIRLSNEHLAHVLKVSRIHRKYIEDELVHVFQSVVVSIPLTPELVDVFNRHGELMEKALGEDACREIRAAVHAASFDRKG